jgi:hypothetical protein
VADNQPSKNRVNTTTSFAEFGAQLRGLIDADFGRLALELFQLQFDGNAPYRLICESRGVSPANVSHWSEIPAVPTSAFKEFDLSCLRPEERTTVFHSSGTTAQKPSHHYHNSESLTIYQEVLMASFRENVIKTGPITVLSLTPSAAEASHSSLVHMFDTVRQELGSPESVFAGRVTRAGEWTLDSATAETCLTHACKTGAPVCILGTAFSFVHFLDHLQQQSKQFKLPPDSIVMETGGYKGKSRVIPRFELHNLICRYFGISEKQIVCEYGMSELSSQAYGRGALHLTPDTSHSVIFQFPVWARSQIISPETGREVDQGETGLIRVFDLANVYSVMAIQTEDLGIRRSMGFELLGRSSFSDPRGCSLMSA